MRDRDFDIEIVERHHRFKKDAPSGTALHFANIIQEALGEMPVRHGREGLVGERPAREIGMHALRAGDNVGEHAIVFSTLGETMELVHIGAYGDAAACGRCWRRSSSSGTTSGGYSMRRTCWPL